MEEELKAWTVEWQDGATVEDCSEDNWIHSFEACARGCGRRCSAVGCSLQSKGPLLVQSGKVEGRQSGNLAVEPYDWVYGGESLDRRVSLEWEGLQEG